MSARAPVLLLALTAAVSMSACNNSTMTRGPMAPGSAMTGTMPGSPQGPMPGAGMSGMPLASEFDFLTNMIPHHEEAVAAARVLQAGTRRQEMRDFAAAIIRTQSNEIAQMRAWLAEWYPGRDTRVTYRPMMRDLSGLSGDAMDRAFLDDMIRHHMMAVMMSQQVLVHGLAQHQALVPFAAEIRDTQTAEIQTMWSWLRQWFGV